MSSEGETSSKREKEDEDENVISMLDVLAEEKQLEEDANAVLGGGDDKNCTYPGGYVKRQPLYSCTTCITTNDSPAGVCLACSYDCHEGHSLVELYTKRNFRCDCGNSKFQRNACKLYATKELENTQNTYNQNFRGVYCTCSRPYPDPEDDVDDDMLQCTICEDWFHSRHLGTPHASGDYDEMVCDQCMAKHTFLQAYAVHSDVVKITPEETPATSQIDVLSDHTTDDDKQPVNGSVKSENKERTDDGLSSTDAAKHNSSENMNGTTSDACNNKSTDVTDASCSVSSESASDHCLLADLSTREATPAVTATYWSNGWRSKLCTCSACQTMYIDQGIGFLIDETDTVHVYEEQAKVKQKATDFERGMDALGSMDRVQLGEIMHGYNNLKEELTNYLKKFAENGKVVREEDIREFFEQMQARKRQKTGQEKSTFVGLPQTVMPGSITEPVIDMINSQSTDFTFKERSITVSYSPPISIQAPPMNLDIWTETTHIQFLNAVMHEWYDSDSSLDSSANEMDLAWAVVRVESTKVFEGELFRMEADKQTIIRWRGFNPIVSRVSLKSVTVQ